MGLSSMLNTIRRAYMIVHIVMHLVYFIFLSVVHFVNGLIMFMIYNWDFLDNF